MAEKLPIYPKNLKNKCVIVTGGASGLGLAMVTRFAEEGAHVTIADIQEELGNKIVSDLTAKGHKVTFVKTDVTNWDSAVTAFKHAVNFSPRKTLDIAAPFAGITGDALTLPASVAKADPEPSLDRDPVQPDLKVLDINLYGVYMCTRLALHYFRLEAAPDAPEVVGKKALILISSLGGYTDQSSTEYCTSKFGVRGLFRSLRASSKAEDSKWTVNILAPSFIPTPLIMEDRPGGPSLLWLREYVDRNGLWCRMEDFVAAISLIATNDEVDGRSFTIWPHGWFDNMEDIDQGFGWPSMMEHMHTSGYIKAAGNRPKGPTST